MFDFASSSGLSHNHYRVVLHATSTIDLALGIERNTSIGRCVGRLIASCAKMPSSHPNALPSIVSEAWTPRRTRTGFSHHRLQHQYHPRRHALSSDVDSGQHHAVLVLHTLSRLCLGPDRLATLVIVDIPAAASARCHCCRRCRCHSEACGTRCTDLTATRPDLSN